MEKTLQDLSGILLRALPTVFLLIVLHNFLKYMLFKPLQAILKKREELTNGARQAANDSLAAAERKAQDYEAKFREARAVVYKEQEETRKVWIEDQGKQVAEGQARTSATLAAARKTVESETAAAKQSLVETSAGLADKIANAVLARRPS